MNVPLCYIQGHSFGKTCKSFYHRIQEENKNKPASEFVHPIFSSGFFMMISIHTHKKDTIVCQMFVNCFRCFCLFVCFRCLCLLFTGEQKGAEDCSTGREEERENREDQVPTDPCQGHHLCCTGQYKVPTDPCKRRHLCCTGQYNVPTDGVPKKATYAKIQVQLYRVPTDPCQGRHLCSNRKVILGRTHRDPSKDFTYAGQVWPNVPTDPCQGRHLMLYSSG